MRKLYFFTVELLPFLTIKFSIKGLDELAMDKVDESVANITFVLIKSLNYW